MPQSILPDYVFNDLVRFIHERCHDGLPNSLIIAQAFILKRQHYGEQFGLSTISKAIEEGIEQGLF
jgi:hypothetical protein